MTCEETGPGVARGPLILLTIGALLAFAVAAAVLVPWDWVPGGHLTPMPVSDLFTPDEVARAEHFATTRRVLSWSSYFLSLAVALLLGLTPAGARLARAVGRRLRWWLGVPLATLVLLLIGRLITLPFSLGLRQQSLDYGLTHQALSGWLVDVAKSFLVNWVFPTLLLLVVIGLARRSPRFWFAWASGAAVLLTALGSFLYPIVVEPLFNDFTPMKASALKDSIFAIADREGVSIDDVLVSDASRRTTTINAYVSGFGDTRRVVVYDNLLKDLSPDEVRVVIAHELGHAKNHDVAIGTFLGAVGGVLGVCLLALVLDHGWVRRRAGIRGPADPAAVALILALVSLGTFLASPAQNTISRAIEARADRASLQATGQDQVFIDMQRQLALRSISDPTPPALSQFWFGSHPTALQRAGLPSSLERAAQ